MTTIATILAAIVITLLSMVVYLSFAIYLKIIKNITAEEESKTGVKRSVYKGHSSPPSPPPLRADWSLSKRRRKKEQQKLNDLANPIPHNPYLITHTP